MVKIEYTGVIQSRLKSVITGAEASWPAFAFALACSSFDGFEKGWKRRFQRDDTCILMERSCNPKCRRLDGTRVSISFSASPGELCCRPKINLKNLICSSSAFLFRPHIMEPNLLTLVIAASKTSSAALSGKSGFSCEIIFWGTR